MRVKYAGLHVLTAPLSGKLYLIHCRYNGQHSAMLIAQTEIEIMSSVIRRVIITLRLLLRSPVFCNQLYCAEDEDREFDP